MDGDVAPLAELLELARRHGCRLMVDEAHATGALGPGGRGSVAAAGLSGEVDVVVGTLGKALGSYGAYVCADAETVDYLLNTRPPLHLLDRAAAAVGRRRRGGAGAARSRARTGSSGCAPTPRPCATALAAEGLAVGRLRDARSCRSRSATRSGRWSSASGCSSAASSPRGSGRRRSPRAPRACASR